MKLKIDIKEKWVNALRSGDYKQTTSLLYDRNTEAYCCLGVLCDVVAKEQGVIAEEFFGHGHELPTSELKAYVSATSFSPSKSYPSFWRVLSPKKNDPTTLFDLNDSGMSFNEIADIIEAQL